MITGYEKPLYILPFDHRHSYITGVFRWQNRSPRAKWPKSSQAKR